MLYFGMKKTEGKHYNFACNELETVKTHFVKTMHYKNFAKYTEVLLKNQIIEFHFRK